MDDLYHDFVNMGSSNTEPQDTKASEEISQLNGLKRSNKYIYIIIYIIVYWIMNYIRFKIDRFRLILSYYEWALISSKDDAR